MSHMPMVNWWALPQCSWISHSGTVVIARNATMEADDSSPEFVAKAQDVLAEIVIAWPFDETSLVEPEWRGLRLADERCGCLSPLEVDGCIG